MIGLMLAGLVHAQAVPETVDYSFNSELFRPPSDFYGYAVTESASTLKHLQMGVGLWVNMSNDPVNFYLNGERVGLVDGVLSASATESGDGVIDRRVNADLQWGMGLSKYFSFTLNMPVVLWQEGFEPSSLWDPTRSNELISSGPGDLRISPKFILVNRDEFPVGVAFLANLTVPTGGKSSFMGEGSPTYTPTLAIELSDQPIHGSEFHFRIAANAGYRIRTPASYGPLRIENEFLYRVAMGIRPVPAVELGADLAGTVGWSDQVSPVEVLPWIQLLSPDLGFVRVGGGVGTFHGLGAPDYRLFASAGIAPSFNPKDLDRDKDGIQNNLDDCPNIPEDIDQFEDHDGCPDPDNDADGLLDPVDACPNEAEDFDQFEDGDGCPDLDNDRDGIVDLEDSCPDDPETMNGYLDLDGCPDDEPEYDTDGDGYPDDTDGCPRMPEDFDRFEDHDGCPDLDNDQDTVLDVNDQCPLDPEDLDGFEDEDGCAEFDNDRDGFPDSLDACPNEPETVNYFEDDDGCPDVAPPRRVSVTKTHIVITDKIYFEVSKAVIQSVSYELIEEIGQVMIDNPHIAHVRIEGHTDSDGGDAYNLRLSQKRADSVRRFLIDYGVEKDRLDAMGFGEMRPLVENDSRENKAKNRRVEFLILGAED